MCTVLHGNIALTCGFGVELRGFEPLTPSEGRPYATPRRTSGGSWPNPLDLKHCRGSNHFVDPTLPDNLVASRRLSEVLSADFVVSHSAVHLGRLWGCHVNHSTTGERPHTRSGTRAERLYARDGHLDASPSAATSPIGKRGQRSCASRVVYGGQSMMGVA